MKTGAVIAIVIGVVAVLYFAVSRGLIGSGAVPLPGGGVAPNPATNYSGYLAATTAPQVSGILNTVLAGVGSGLHSWLSTPAPTPVVGQGANPSSPAYAAQPSGLSTLASIKTAGGTITGNDIASAGLGARPGTVGLTDSTIGNGLIDTSLVGPQVSPALSYNSTPGSAFDYSGLASQNAYDPSTTLYDGAAFA